MVATLKPPGRKRPLTNAAKRALARAKASSARTKKLIEERAQTLEQETIERRKETLTPRWTELDWHPEQTRLWQSKARFRVVPAGRRSGKTERAKRFIIKEALRCKLDRALFVCGAPTRDQAKAIFWEDLKAMVPRKWVESISESYLTITLVTGTRLQVVGLDKAHRIEGEPGGIQGCILDEYAEMKPEVWTSSLRPSLSTRDREGWCWFIGRPKGRNHYYDLYKQALEPDNKDWDAFHWVSGDILNESEIEAAARELDPLTFDQEYNASFVNFSGRAYYGFSIEKHAHERCTYDPTLPLIFCFDFNVEPGIAVVVQEQQYKGKRKNVGEYFTAVIGEVYIPRNSNTPRVCKKLIQDWGHHKGRVYCYGDASGGARRTSATRGTDWDIVRNDLRAHFGTECRVMVRPDEANPPERSRVNSVNTRLLNGQGMIHCLLDPKAAKMIIHDLDSVILLEGGSGEIDKDYDPRLTHMSDALGYYMFKKHGVHKSSSRSQITNVA